MTTGQGYYWQSKGQNVLKTDDTKQCYFSCIHISVVNDTCI